MKGTKNLTQGPILKQLFTLAMPIMATSFIQMAYSLTDMAWVGRIGSEGNSRRRFGRNSYMDVHIYLSSEQSRFGSQRRTSHRGTKRASCPCIRIT